MKYYIYEHQKRDDGEVNVVPVVSRTDLPKGLSYYYERLSKMQVTTLFPSVSVMLVDENLKVIEKKTIDDTCYVPPVEEPAEETPTEETTE